MARSQHLAFIGAAQFDQVSQVVTKVWHLAGALCGTCWVFAAWQHSTSGWVTCHRVQVGRVVTVALRGADHISFATHTAQLACGRCTLGSCIMHVPQQCLRSPTRTRLVAEQLLVAHTLYVHTLELHAFLCTLCALCVL